MRAVETPREQEAVFRNRVRSSPKIHDGKSLPRLVLNRAYLRLLSCNMAYWTKKAWPGRQKENPRRLGHKVPFFGGKFGFFPGALKRLSCHQALWQTRALACQGRQCGTLARQSQYSATAISCLSAMAASHPLTLNTVRPQSKSRSLMRGESPHISTGDDDHCNAICKSNHQIDLQIVLW